MMGLKRAVITGGTGMIALALEQYLIENGVEVYCVVRPQSARLSHIKEHHDLHVIECDLSELHKLPDLISQKCDTMFHLGWEGTFGDNRNNAFLQEKNIKFTLDAVEAAAALNCESFVGAGSQAEYGRVQGTLKADTPTNPENGYGISKLAAGKLSEVLCKSLNIRHSWVRILSVYGPYDLPNTMVMTCLNSFLNNDPSSFTKGEQLWDYLYCGDAAKALFLIAERGKNGAVYPLGGGAMRALKEYVLTIRDLVNPNLVPGIGLLDYNKGQVMHLCADLTTLTEDTGFIPETDFESGIKLTLEWLKNQSSGSNQ